MWYLTLHRWIGRRDVIAPDLLESHLEWIKAHQLAGRMLFAGPSVDGELGIIVFGAADATDIERLCREELFIAAGRKTFEVIP